MLYLKSALVGLLTVVIGSIVFPIVGIVGIVVYTSMHSASDGTSVGWDPISLAKRPPFFALAFIVVCFASGFFWEFRRLTRK